MINEQKIVVSNTEPVGSIKAKVIPKTKTNADVKQDIRTGIIATIKKKRGSLAKFKETVEG